MRTITLNYESNEYVTVKEVKELKNTKAFQYEFKNNIIVVKHHGEKIAVYDKGTATLIVNAEMMKAPKADEFEYKLFNYLNTQLGIAKLYYEEV